MLIEYSVCRLKKGPELLGTETADFLISLLTRLSAAATLSLCVIVVPKFEWQGTYVFVTEVGRNILFINSFIFVLLYSFWRVGLYVTVPQRQTVFSVNAFHTQSLCETQTHSRKFINCRVWTTYSRWKTTPPPPAGYPPPAAPGRVPP